MLGFVPLLDAARALPVLHTARLVAIVSVLVRPISASMRGNLGSLRGSSCTLAPLASYSAWIPRFPVFLSVSAQLVARLGPLSRLPGAGPAGARCACVHLRARLVQRRERDLASCVTQLMVSSGHLRPLVCTAPCAADLCTAAHQSYSSLPCPSSLCRSCKACRQPLNGHFSGCGGCRRLVAPTRRQPDPGGTVACRLRRHYVRETLCRASRGRPASGLRSAR